MFYCPNFNSFQFDSEPKSNLTCVPLDVTELCVWIAVIPAAPSLQASLIINSKPSTFIPRTGRHITGWG